MKTLHDFTSKALDGSDFDMSQLKGKKVLIVNVASECGFTPQYKVLQEMYEEFGGDKFEIIGFPSNEFGGQEPGTADDIAQFCSVNYGVTFPIMSKTTVKDDADPIFKFLTHKEGNGVEDAPIPWNFHKFLVDENGNYVAQKPSTVSPADDSILSWINE